jgi:uncharacterized protein YjbI with pentapeptide repeats
MNKCSHNDCQFKYFLLQEKGLYSEDSAGYTYCIFHAPEDLKESFKNFQDGIFERLIKKYMHDCIRKGKTINFSDVVFHLPFIQNNIDTSSFYFNFTTKNKIICDRTLNINFTNATFLKSFRMDNLKCATLTFQDTNFHKGGGLKNRDSNENLYIENLIFRPYQLDSDFVIDIGQYANKEGLIEIKYGIIKKMRFENHKEGNARIYFIGLNNNLEEANFRNMVLDKVSFQNCDLSKCYFLNAKIDETEFRNCKFDINNDANHTWIVFIIVYTLCFLILLSLTNAENISVGLAYIGSIFSLFIGLNLHKSIFDEKNISTKHGEKEEETWISISETYGVLKDNISKNNYQIQLLYSASQFIAPFIPKNKAWFKVNSYDAMYLTILESILLFLFFGAFILAIKNRIKR